MKTKVYRVEDEGLQGPYNPSNYNKIIWSIVPDARDVRYHTPEDGHPEPSTEGLPMRSDYRSAFTSMKLLHRWFDEVCLGILIANGYAIHEYVVDERYIHSSETQCTIQAIHLNDYKQINI